MEEDVLTRLRQELIEGIDEKTRDGASRFFKEEVRFYGVKSSLVRKIATKYFREIKGRDKREIFTLCEELLRSDYGEEAFIAFEWAYSLRSQYEPSDFTIFEGWLERYVNNWASAIPYATIHWEASLNCILNTWRSSLAGPGQTIDGCGGPRL